MKKIKNAKGFITAGLVISIIFVASMTLMSFIGLVLFVIGVIQASADTYSASLAVGTYLLTYGIVLDIFAIAGLVLNAIALGKVNNMKSKKDAVTAGILAIISGYLFSILPIPGGIMLLTVKQEDIK